MRLITDLVKEKLDMLSFKYRETLRAIDTAEIDTLLGIVYNANHYNEYADYIAEDVTCLSESQDSLSIPDEINCLIEELRHIYDQFGEMGMSVDDVRQSLWSLESVSCLEVHNDLCISFPDYQNKIIRFSRMQYAVYRLFLNHPEGILLKHIPNYIDELREIYIETYQYTGGYLNHCSLEKKLKNIADPTNHTLIEYISRIRNIIVTTLGSDTLARHYYIRGTRNHSYSITILREFVKKT